MDNFLASKLDCEKGADAIKQDVERKLDKDRRESAEIMSWFYDTLSLKSQWTIKDGCLRTRAGDRDL